MAPWRPSRAGDTGGGRLTPDALAREGYALHGAELYRYALGRLLDDAAAQDVVQETIVRAWRAGDRYDPQTSSLRTWLFAIARNVVADHLSARRRAAALPDLVDQPGKDHMSDHSAALADVDLVTRALGLISHDHRTAIVETYLRDRSYDDVAADLGVSVSTLRSRVFHGLRHLRRAMALMVIEP
ncbi:RNA polymerase sigma factor [Aeromicrobium sp. Root472D3]|uniref:RNA polymerase sigma factor n=1 Tax=Aeromicrobium sp. Root472D3 TaxID=1736540 RepID=UPI000AC01DCA|nr:sigma-70 family RNA polymerase sigma factor [Aeromicrobium sp. Root472D3]